MAVPGSAGPPSLEEVLLHTLEALGQAREQVFAIAESARGEYERLRREVEAIRQEAEACIREVDRLEQTNRAARARLAEMSRAFSSAPRRVSEADLQMAYRQAEEAQVALSVAREREVGLRRRRDDLERSLRHLRETVERAEHMLAQVTVAREYLAGSLRAAVDEAGALRARGDMAHRLLQVQEAERRRVARELHDGPAQMLAAAALGAEVCQQLAQAGGSPDTALREQLLELKQAIRWTLQELRRIIFNLRPLALEAGGLVPALQRLAEQASGPEGPKVAVSIRGVPRRLSEPLEVAAFRFVQEALQNAVRHARARQVQIWVEFSAQQLQLMVADDGVGFDLAAVEAEYAAGGHLGLASMRERMAFLGGEVRLESAPGQGTRVTARLPLGSEAASEPVPSPTPPSAPAAGPAQPARGWGRPATDRGGAPSRREPSES